MSSNDQSAVEVGIDRANTESTCCPTDSPHLNRTCINLDDIKNLEDGNHISWRRTYGLWHHAIVMKVNAEQKTLTVIHLSKDKTSSNTIIVHDEEIVCEKANGDLFRIDYKDNERLPLEHTMALAKQMKGKNVRYQSYCPLTNNCEHFATYCATGHCISHQANEVYKQLASTELVLQPSNLEQKTLTVIHSAKEKTSSNIIAHVDEIVFGKANEDFYEANDNYNKRLPPENTMTVVKEPRQYLQSRETTGEVHASHRHENASIGQKGTDELFSSRTKQKHPSEISLNSFTILADTMTEKNIIKGEKKAKPFVMNQTVAIGASVFLNERLSNTSKLSAQQSEDDLTTAVRNASQNEAQSVAQNTSASGDDGRSDRIATEEVQATAKQSVSPGVKKVVKETTNEEMRPTVSKTLTTGVKEIAKKSAKTPFRVALILLNENKKINKQSPTTVTRKLLTRIFFTVTREGTDTIVSTGVQEVYMQSPKKLTATFKITASKCVQKVKLTTVKIVKVVTSIETIKIRLVPELRFSTVIEEITEVTKEKTKTVIRKEINQGGISNVTLIIFGMEVASTVNDIYGLYKRKLDGKISNKDFVETATQRVIAGLVGVAGALACAKLRATIETMMYPGKETGIGSYLCLAVFSFCDFVVRRIGICVGLAVVKRLSSWWS